MSKDLIVVLPAPYIRHSLNLYRWQLEQAGIDYVFVQPAEVGNLGGRLAVTRRAAEHFSDYHFIICSDAFDVTFYGTKAEVMAKIPDHGVLQAGEKNCWPDVSLAERIKGSTPWRFQNGGLSAGTPQSFLTWCDAVEGHADFNPEMCDQDFFNRRLAESSPLCRLDSRTDVFFCLYKGYEELQFDHGHPVNTLCGTRPNFIHANGTWEYGTMLARYLESINAQRKQETAASHGDCRTCTEQALLEESGLAEDVASAVI